MTLEDHERTRDQLNDCILFARMAQQEARDRAHANPVLTQSRALTWLDEELGDLIERTQTQVHAVDARILEMKKSLGESAKP